MHPARDGERGQTLVLFVIFLVLILTTPYEMGQDLSYNAPGLAILQQGNRYLQFDPTAAKIGLVALLCFSCWQSPRRSLPGI